MTSTNKKNPVIEVKKNGSYIVIDIATFKNTRNENIPVKPVMSLCRCGASENKPFCDGMHRRIGFSDEKADDLQPDIVDIYEGKKITIHDNRGVYSPPRILY